MFRILFIENDDRRCGLIRTAFARPDSGFTLEFARHRDAALDTAARSAPDLVFFSPEDGAQDILPFLARLFSRAPRTLPVLVAGCADQQFVLSCFRAGIQECVADSDESIKDFPAAADRVLARSDGLPAGPRLPYILYSWDRLATLGRLVSGVMHEANNRLTGTLAYSELLAMKQPQNVPKEDIEKIVNSAEDCRRIIDNLQALSRGTVLGKSVESLAGILDRTLALRAYAFRAANIETVRDIDRACSLFVDAQQLQHALLHIVFNAEEAIVSSGRKPGRIRITAGESGSDRNILIRIEDSGDGIPSAILPRIFDPFFSTRPDRAGLGLFIAKQIIEDNGGSLRVEPGSIGALMVITLPAGASVPPAR